MPEDSAESTGFSIAERGWLCVPCPLVSRGRVVLASNGGARGLMRGSTQRGERAPWRAEAEGEAWIEVQTGVGPDHVLVRLEATPGERLPARYRIESAVLGRDGRGDWRPELTVVDNGARTRAHVIEFDGQGTLRVTFEAEQARPALSSVDVHDASDGTDDVWLVLGDALASLGLSEDGGAHGFAEGVHAGYAGYFPALIDESRAGESPGETLARLGALLELHADARRVALAFGGVDARALAAAPLAELARVLLAAGRIPMFSRAPMLDGSPREVASFNARLDALEHELGLARGPDPSAWAKTWLVDGTADAPRLAALPAEARDALAALWVDAADVFYVPV
jgi:hypothetical protein